MAFDAVSFALGLGLGALLLFLWARQQTGQALAQAAERAKAEADAERSRLYAERDKLLMEQQDRLAQEMAARATAEERARRVPALEEEIRELGSLRALVAELETELDGERKAAAEKLAILEQAQQTLSDHFKALSAEALDRNNRQFLDLAHSRFEKLQEGAKGDLDKRQQAIHELVQPVRLSLDKVDVKIQEMEQARAGAYEGLKQQVSSLMDSQRDLRAETSNLVKALRSPIVRGRWGEIQLKRVVELAGMLDHCDFYEQRTAEGEDGRLRPDMLVRLPGGKTIVIDAKVPLAAYLEAAGNPDEDDRRQKLQDHVRHVRLHLKALTARAYQEQFRPTPEFVVMFLPAESIFSAALEQDPALIEAAVAGNVVLASPTTLISLLKAVAYGWQQQRVEENARAIAELGRELYKRLANMGDHMARLGNGLSGAVRSYNEAVGSLETRVLVTARRFKDLESVAANSEMKELAVLDIVPREVRAPELLLLGGGESS